MPKISHITLGCKLNFAETTSIVREFNENGYQTVKFSEKADVVIINSCTVTAQAERKSVYAAKKAAKISPDAKIIVVGCAAQTNPERFLNIPQVELVLSTSDKFKAFSLINGTVEKKIYSCDINEVSNFDHAYSTTERTRSFLKIQDGCDYKCSYCTIPKARGKSRNTKIYEIINDANTIAKTGVKEIILTGVNIGDFGKSTGETFFNLIKELEKVHGIERYRISSIEPNLLTSEIIDFVAESEKFMPHFHIPLQAGSDDVLKLMKRRYNTTMFRDKIHEVHQKLPDAFLGIDVIVGFPGETSDNFQQTYELLSSLPISYLHIFPYSDREGTVASKIAKKVPSEWIKDREKTLKKLSDEKNITFNERFLSKKRSVLFEGNIKNGGIYGFTDNYLKVYVKTNSDLKNKIKEVELISQNDDVIFGEIVN